MAIEIGAMCELGTRKNQQDSFLYHLKNNTCLAVVCDGMGGLEGGERASKYVVNTLVEDFKQADCIGKDIPFFLKEEALKLDKEVFQLKNDSGERIGAGTTIVAVVIQQNKIHWLTVGDSRIYVLRGDEIVPVNVKHNYKLQLDEMFENQMISSKIYENEIKHADKLISYLGKGDITIWEINDNPLELYGGDYILLCSDGITNTILEKQIQEIILKHKNVERCIKEFQTIIRRRVTCQDNATCILLKYVEEK